MSVEEEENLVPFWFLMQDGWTTQNILTTFGKYQDLQKEKNIKGQNKSLLKTSPSSHTLLQFDLGSSKKRNSQTLEDVKPGMLMAGNKHVEIAPIFITQSQYILILKWQIAKYSLDFKLPCHLFQAVPPSSSMWASIFCCQSFQWAAWNKWQGSFNSSEYFVICHFKISSAFAGFNKALLGITLMPQTKKQHSNFSKKVVIIAENTWKYDYSTFDLLPFPIKPTRNGKKHLEPVQVCCRVLPEALLRFNEKTYSVFFHICFLCHLGFVWHVTSGGGWGGRCNWRQFAAATN